MNWRKIFSLQAAGEEQKEEVTFSERLSALRNLPRFFALIWKTSPALAGANVFLRLIRSAIPVASAVCGQT